MSQDLVSIRTVGGLLPADLIGRVIAGDRDLAGLSATDYHLVGAETPREAANRAWAYLSGAWVAYKSALEKLPEGDRAVGLTREKWLQPLLGQLGYGRVPNTAAGGIQVDDRSFPVSHLWEQVPIHLLGWGVELDKRTKGVPGAAERAPHAMLQELLNRTDNYLFGVVSNGRVLRLLRDSTSLSGQSFVEFDLEAMFDGEVFSDFAVLFLLLHQSRVEILTADAPASDCWLEKWRTTAIESGTRALGLLRDGVQQAITALGTGFVAHPSNGEFNRKLADKEISLDDFHRGLLRLVYRLLFLFVAEDRGALLDPDATPQVAARYQDYFSTARLRRMALTRRGTRHGDLWQALSLVIEALGREGGRRELGLPGLGGLFDAGPADLLGELQLPNDALLAAVRYLSVVQPKGQPKRTVDYRNLGAEELGSIYESLLELVPRHNSLERTFSLEVLAGNERKTSGSYYTPTSLIDLLLDETLDPLLDDAEKAGNPETALLAVTVCDPACGSGHFLVAAARRIAQRLATVRTGDVDSTPTDLQNSLHDVVGRCIYGVDLNPMAAELAKVSLWLEAIQPGRPLSFLDAHIKVGNALLGTTPALLAGGIPDAAYSAIEGDDKKHAAALKKRNRTERDRADQVDLFDVSGLEVGNRALREQVSRLQQAPTESLADLHHAQQRYRDYQHSPELLKARRLADAWCAAFVQAKAPGGIPITHHTLTAIAADTASEDAVDLVDSLATQYRFFHWHLEFPEIYDTPEVGATDTSTGWNGGFAALIGNPPWERVKLQEQEFFVSRAADIADAQNASKRKKLIADLVHTNPTLATEFAEALRRSEGESHFLRDSARYPLCGVGDVNTYSVFAEHMRTAINTGGRMGVVTPTGLATDITTAAFFADSVSRRQLVAFYDFENEGKIFPTVTNKQRFSITCMTGGQAQERIRFAFYTRHVQDVAARRYDLAAEEVRALNPKTGTLPVFRSRMDADITLAIYGRLPILIRDDTPDGNPWGLSFLRLYDLANDSDLFRTEEDLRRLGAEYDGWGWTNGEMQWLPVYEAKMLSHFDHRFATYENATQAQRNKGTLPRLTQALHDRPDVEPLARYWIAATDLEVRLEDRWERDWFLGWRDIASGVNERTFIPCVVPRTAIGHSFPVAIASSPDRAPLIQAIWSSFIFDFLARQKISGSHLIYSLLEQLAAPLPRHFDEPTPWMPSQSLSDFTTTRVLELSFTSWRLISYARDMGDDKPPFRWIPERRASLRAELDAALFHIFKLGRAEVEHVLDSFFVVRKYEERDFGEFRTKRLVLERYDAMQTAIESAVPYETPLDPLPGQGPRHPEES